MFLICATFDAQILFFRSIIMSVENILLRELIIELISKSCIDEKSAYMMIRCMPLAVFDLMVDWCFEQKNCEAKKTIYQIIKNADNERVNGNN